MNHTDDDMGFSTPSQVILEQAARAWGAAERATAAARAEVDKLDLAKVEAHLFKQVVAEGDLGFRILRSQVARDLTAALAAERRALMELFEAARAVSG